MVGTEETLRILDGRLDILFGCVGHVSETRFGRYTFIVSLMLSVGHDDLASDKLLFTS